MAESLQIFITDLVDTLFAEETSISNLESALKKTIAFLGADCGWINLWKDNFYSGLFIEYALPEALKNIESKLHRDCQCQNLIINNKDCDFFYVTDCGYVKKFLIAVDNFIGHLSIPIRSRKEFLATINIAFKEKKEVNRETIRLISKTFGAAISNYIFTKKIEEKNRQLNQKSKDLETLVTAISHDMKTPIITTKGFLHLIEKKYHNKMTREHKSYLNNINKGLNRIEELVKDLLNLKQTEKLLKISEIIDVKDALKSSLKYIRPLIRHRLPKIKIEGTPPKLFGNNLAFFQIFTNLIANSIKYTPDDRTPRVNIIFKEEEDNYLIKISDNGIGMTEKELKEAFKPFNKVKTIDREGSGVGLSIVKRIVEGFGGRINVVSEKNVGTTFYIYWSKKENLEDLYAEGETRTRTGVNPLDPEPSVSASSTTSA